MLFLNAGMHFETRPQAIRVACHGAFTPRVQGLRRCAIYAHEVRDDRERGFGRGRTIHGSRAEDRDSYTRWMTFSRNNSESTQTSHLSAADWLTMIRHHRLRSYGRWARLPRVTMGLRQAVRDRYLLRLPARRKGSMFLASHAGSGSTKTKP